eukprot:gnl/MRDRNA2_/MRDRNA2_85359_c0_seq1.p1 gnl/MRDRNA2_/MRDRNA2_85359_c0~~gnl/MRDRNA2_/MRDRNA2_85359_c0_seq1.p1  ORF type:complete len:306 (-),score=-8.49 gnl/MRDRNA2_/MRDRNA2_85359_c0_seq1:73-990(-)
MFPNPRKINGKNKIINYSGQSQLWELHLCPRSMLSERGKKLWEITVTDENMSFVFSEFILSNNISSSSLERILKKLLTTPGTLKPVGCLYFASQTENIISRALTRLNIRATPSRRCFAIAKLLNERKTTTLALNPGYTPQRINKLSKNNVVTQTLPEQLRGDRWAFVQLPFSELTLESRRIWQEEIFGACPNLKWLSKGIPRDATIPGLVVYSKRAFPLAAWTHSHQLVEIAYRKKENCLVIEHGTNQRWLYGKLTSSVVAKREAEEWEKAKIKAKGIHFLAIQCEDALSDLEGIWIMRNIESLI